MQGAYDVSYFDDNDAAIVQESAASQLALDEKREIPRQSETTGQSIWAAFSGTHRAVKVRIYRVRSMDGLAWTYAQPYSTSYQMPGEHSFVLRGSFPQPIEVQPPDNNWRRPRFLMAVGMISLLLLFVYGAGLLVFGLFALMFPMRAKFKSPDPALAKWIKSQSTLVNAVRGTKWGWLGLLGSGGWRLPWVVRLTPRGDGSSDLVIKAPDIGRLSLTRYRVGFSQAAHIARSFQSVLVQR
ncbi:MAG: hypothetical protein ACREJX_20640, partial [Polyangiaceae bacterium]